jgi:hypothetical protein
MSLLLWASSSAFDGYAAKLPQISLMSSPTSRYSTVQLWAARLSANCLGKPSFRISSSFSVSAFGSFPRVHCMYSARTAELGCIQLVPPSSLRVFSWYHRVWCIQLVPRVPCVYSARVAEPGFSHRAQCVYSACTAKLGSFHQARVQFKPR